MPTPGNARPPFPFAPGKGAGDPQATFHRPAGANGFTMAGEVRGLALARGPRLPSTVPPGRRALEPWRGVPESGVLGLLRLSAAIPLAGQKQLNPENLNEP